MMTGQPLKSTPDLRAGIAAFNQQDFHNAHERFETAWRAADETERSAYRILIHLSGGFFRLTQNRTRAAGKFFQHALQWSKKHGKTPDILDGIDLKTYLQGLINKIDHQVDAESLLKLHFKPLIIFHPEQANDHSDE